MNIQALMDTLENLLNQNRPEGVTIHRHILTPVDKDHLPVIVPYLMALKPKQGQDTGNDVRRYTAEIRIECRATGQPVETVLAPMIHHVQRVMLAPPPFLDSWAMDIEEGDIQIDALAKDKTYIAAALDYKVEIAYSLGIEPPEGPSLRQITHTTPDNRIFKVSEND